MFHNNIGPMCLQQLSVLKSMKTEYPSLEIEEKLTYKSGIRASLYELESKYGKSIGVSRDFGYLPLTFINNHAYSGFNQKVKEMLEKDIKDVCR